MRPDPPACTAWPAVPEQRQGRLEPVHIFKDCFLPWLRWIRPFWLGLPILVPVLPCVSPVSLCNKIYL
jgi:hypothetical protein